MRVHMLLKKIVFSLALLSATTAYSNQQKPNHLELAFGWLDLKPMSNNYTYAYYVSGTQPYFQDWHAQTIDPSYSSAFELGVLYQLKEMPLNANIDWVHLSSTDSAYKQGNQTLQVANIEFVGPPFEMSPPVFGIRRADAELKYHFDDVAINLEKIFMSPKKWMNAKIIGGINILYLKQNFSTTFSDLVGAEPTPYTYPLPADPSFSFNIQSISQFMGIGPDLGLNGQLEIFKGLSITGTACGSLAVGTISVQENFKATSAQLTQKGIGVSKQQITTPNKTQIVPGFDGKLGLIYKISSQHIPHFSIEGGYRLMSYMNAISTTSPQTLVQPGTNPAVPEFSTGTMAIVSVTQQDRPFNLNGPYATLRFSVM